MLPHLSVHFKTHADDHILPLLLKVWTIPFPHLVTGDQRLIPILSGLSFPSPSGKLSLYGVQALIFATSTNET